MDNKDHSALDATIRVVADDLDQKIAKVLSDQLGTDVQVISAELTGDSLIKQASDDSTQAHIANPSTDCDSVRIALSLSVGSVAVWTTESSNAPNSARHGFTVLQLQKSQSRIEQLDAEVDSLTAQVMNDFEELALIRSLASSVPLPNSGNEVAEFILTSMQPLCEGVGARSIAVLLADENGNRTLEPIWSGEPVLSAQQVNRLVEEHVDEANFQPVVRNSFDNEAAHTDTNLSEFVMTKCHSEDRLHGWIIACNRVSVAEDVPWAQRGFTTVQASLIETATNQLASQLHNLRLLKQKEDLFTDVVRALVNAVEARDPYTCGHSERVASFASCLARLAGQSAKDVDRIYLTGLLHDVGKITIPDGVLQKPGKLDDDERRVIETHTDAGWRILQELEALRYILPGVLYHHEHYNGKGYPDGLVGENIPIDGRILAVCDAFDAMTSDRPYRKGMPIQKAAGILQDGAGDYWDPRLIEAFINNLAQFDQIRLDHQPRQQPVRPAPVEGVPTFLASPQTQS